VSAATSAAPARLPGSRLLLMMIPLVTIVAFLLLLVVAGMEVLSVARAYVGGEGLWSKGQKEAVYFIVRYARTRDELDYRRFRQALAVPLGDRKARVELEKANPDIEAAKRGFIEGGNHPDDVQGMAALFRRFRNVSYIDKAIGIWTEGDRLIAQLQAAGKNLHDEIATGNPDVTRVSQLLAEVEFLNEQLRPLADAFSYTLGEASRWMHKLFAQLLVLAAAGLVMAAAFVTAGMLRRIERAEVAMRRSESRLRLAAQALENIAEAVFVAGTDRVIVSVNRAFHEVTGYVADQAVGRPAAFLFEAPDIAEAWRAADASGRWEGEIHCTRRSGEGFPAWLSLAGVRETELGAVTHYVGVLKDITEQKRYEEKLEYLAHHDALTRLPNRVQFIERAREVLARAARHGGAVGLLFVDLDGFKAVNDSLGHAAGDQLLRAIGGRLLDGVREEDLVARLGGDEFCVLLDGLKDPKDAAAVAQKLLAGLANPFQLDRGEARIAASIGISCYPQHGDDVETLLARADAAMYGAKEGGRNRYRFHGD